MIESHDHLWPNLAKPLLKRKRSTSLISLGSCETNSLDLNYDLNYEPPSSSFKHGRPTLNKSKPALLILQDAQLSLTQSGSTLSKEKPLISTTFSLVSTLPWTTINMPKVLEKLSLNLEPRIHQNPVTTHGDWTIAFDLTRDAYLFMFAHRAEELKLYQRHTLQHFATKQESEHLRVIALNKAIRKQVSEQCNLLLSDSDQFSDLWSMHLNHFGAAEPSWTSGTTATASADWPPIWKWNEVCRNWNKGVCGWEKICFYLHVCELCLKKGHTSDKCLTKGATGEVLDLKARQPGWVCNLMWCDLDLGLSRAALWTKYTEPLPSVPIDEFHNEEAIRTISLFPHLFKLISPINFAHLKVCLLIIWINHLLIL